MQSFSGVDYYKHQIHIFFMINGSIKYFYLYVDTICTISIKNKRLALHISRM